MSKHHPPLALLYPLVLSLLIPGGCKREQPPPEPAPAAPAATTAAGDPAWDVFVGEYIEAFLRAHPPFAVVAGRHEYDGLLPDWSAAGIAAEIARLHAAREGALAFDYGRLSAQQRYQRDYLVARIRRDLFWLFAAET